MLPTLENPKNFIIIKVLLQSLIIIDNLTRIGVIYSYFRIQNLNFISKNFMKYAIKYFGFFSLLQVSPLNDFYVSHPRNFCTYWVSLILKHLLKLFEFEK